MAALVQALGADARARAHGRAAVACERCGRLRTGEAPAAGAGELVCVECGAKSEDGVGWKGEVAPDLLERVDDDEVAVYCTDCWPREFSPDAPASGDA